MSEKQPTTRSVAEDLIAQPKKIGKYSGEITVPTFRNAVDAVSFHPKIRRILADNPPGAFVKRFEGSRYESFEGMIGVDLLNEYGEMFRAGMKEALEADLSSKGKSPEELATRRRVMNDYVITEILSPAQYTLTEYLFAIQEKIISCLQRDKGESYLPSDIVERLRKSSQAFTAPAALTIGDFNRFDLNTDGAKHMEEREGGRVQFSLGSEKLRGMRGRGCPLNVFGDLKAMYDHYVEIVAIIAASWQESTAGKMYHE